LLVIDFIEGYFCGVGTSFEEDFDYLLVVEVGTICDGLFEDSLNERFEFDSKQIFIRFFYFDIGWVYGEISQYLLC
jgi:hypothetical protein